MLRYEVIEKPIGLPVDLEFVKAHVVEDLCFDDVLLEEYIKAAAAHLEGSRGIAGIALLSQTVRQSYPCFSKQLILPFGWARELKQIQYYDENDTLTVFEAGKVFNDINAEYVWFPDNQVFPKTAKRPDAVQVDYIAGFGNGCDIPTDIKLAIATFCAEKHMNREETQETGRKVRNVAPFGFSELIQKYRRFTL